MTTTLNLKALFILRSIAIACELLALTLAIQLLHMDLPVKSVFMVVGLHAVINTVTWLRQV
jgi:hypothetical protein